MNQSGKIIQERYRIEKKLSQGGYGITYLAVDIYLPSHPKCVVKQLSLQSDNPNIILLAREMFQREAKVLERLGEKHDQIPKLLAHFDEHEEFYLVQEFIDGHDLSHEILIGNCLSENEVIALLQDILQVLDFIHQHNVIHRDIKPSNLIRRTSDSKIVIIDFGVVKEISTIEIGLKGQVNITHKVGTSGYMPTEQENGNPQQNSDIYALGIIAIQALTGLNPCSLEKDIFGNVIWRKYALQASNHLSLVLEKMVHPNFELRYQSAKEALFAINEASKFILTVAPQSTQHPVVNESSKQNLHNSLLPIITKKQTSFSLVVFSFLFSIVSVLSSFDNQKTAEPAPIPAKEQPKIYEDNQIKINLKEVCKEDFIYKDTEEFKNKIPIQKLGLEYRNDLTNVWPVFRWACVYKRTKKNRWEITQPKLWGMDLDEYCRKFHPDKPKASHHDYNDPDSLHCTRPHP